MLDISEAILKDSPYFLASTKSIAQRFISSNNCLKYTRGNAFAIFPRALLYVFVASDLWTLSLSALVL